MFSAGIFAESFIGQSRMNLRWLKTAASPKVCLITSVSRRLSWNLPTLRNKQQPLVRSGSRCFGSVSPWKGESRVQSSVNHPTSRDYFSRAVGTAFTSVRKCHASRRGPTRGSLILIPNKCMTTFQPEAWVAF